MPHAEIPFEPGLARAILTAARHSALTGSNGPPTTRPGNPVRRRPRPEETEAAFRRVLDAAPDAVAVGTRERFAYANPALVRMLGRESMAEVTGAPLSSYLHPEDRPAARRLVEDALGTRKPQPLTPLRLIRADGGVLPIELRVMVVDWEGEPMLLGVGRDLTERRRLQTRLIQADRMASVGTLAAGVAHEINNPLAYVTLNLEYLIRALPRFSGDPATLDRLLDRLAEAHHGARRVSAIVSDLRTFSQPELQERSAVDIGDVIRDAVKVATPQLGDETNLVLHLDEPIPLVGGSGTRLEQVFVNLLINAAQARKEPPASQSIRVSVFEENGHVVVEVSDTGRGIPAHLVDRVFDPFFTTKARGHGTGLGLPICHRLVTSMRGEIAVESVPGEGTTFRVSLPALGPSETIALEEPAPAAGPSGPSKRARLLVIDDEPIVADMLMRTLSEEHDVTVATNADDALKLLLSREFDVVFCDLLMPEVSGMALYAELRERRPGLEDRLVFMTGGAFTPKAAEFLSNVPNQTLKKPFDLDEIARVVEEVAAG